MMIAALLGQAAEWIRPEVDWHALAPELVLIVGINLILAIDLWIDESRKWILASLTGFILLGALVPVVTLAVIGDDSRSMFFDRYVVDDYALILKALFRVYPMSAASRDIVCVLSTVPPTILPVTAHHSV